MSTKLFFIVAIAIAAVLWYSLRDYFRSLSEASQTVFDALPLGDKLHIAFTNLGFIMGLSKTRPALPNPVTTPATDTTAPATDTNRTTETTRTAGTGRGSGTAEP